MIWSTRTLVISVIVVPNWLRWKLPTPRYVQMHTPISVQRTGQGTHLHDALRCTSVDFDGAVVISTVYPRPCNVV